MEKITEKLNTLKQWSYKAEIIKLIFRGSIPIVFLVSGVVILALRIPGWSLLLGAPLTILGTVFLIYAYDQVLRTRIGSYIPPEIEEEENQ